MYLLYRQLRQVQMKVKGEKRNSMDVASALLHTA